MKDWSRKVLETLKETAQVWQQELESRRSSSSWASSSSVPLSPGYPCGGGVSRWSPGGGR